MKFSEYVILGRQGLLMDPLGFLSPYTALQDKLFKQFTVLSNQPAYHGVLALIYTFLAERGIAPGQKDFALQFRRAEILWGLLHTVESASSTVLNITKYTALMRERDSLALGDIRNNDRIYASLGYGTLGHYSSPSSTWGILDKAGKQLTARGSELASAFGKRKGKSLRAALDSWWEGESWDLGRMNDHAALFETGAPAGRAEAQVWRTLISEYCDRTPAVRCLWDRPISVDEDEDWQHDAASYAAGFDAWRSRYAPLKTELTQVELFQQLIGLVQHIFEREYLSCAEKDNGPLPFDELEEDLAGALRVTARAYGQMPDAGDTKGLFAGLTEVRDYQDAAQRILAHHVAHQKAKGSTPFMEDGELRVQGKFEVLSYGERRSALAKAGGRGARLALVAFQHRRDWHFQRANRYHLHAQA
ncbi:hypothetical protein FVD38_12210 [Massilia arenae]|uniref:Uncharacterized protein n=2 Tax=Massilia arenae TaxID=2603288 RepID=A0A5C7FUJ9_9BURK|nr:hypothetical protein FVD38_12210 [Massilia arenae]